MIRCVGLTVGSLMGTLLGPAGTARAAAKVDEVVFQNGDRLTGEIKKLDRGKLNFETDPTDKILIEWTDVVHLTSPQHLEVETFRGQRHFGRLEGSAEPGRLRVAGYDSSVELAMKDVVRITPIKDRFVSRIDGLLNLGYSYSQATDLTTLTFSASANYRVPKYLFGLDLSTNVTDQESGNTSREDLAFRYQRFLRKRWFTEWAVKGESNEELGIDLRTSVTGSAGRYVIQSNHVILSSACGLSYNREQLVQETGGVSETDDSLEVLGQLRWEIFRDRNPDTDLVAKVSVFPSLTDWGRVRADLDISLRRELFKDFFWQLRLTETYDNRPASEDIPTSELFVDTSFGWSF